MEPHDARHQRFQHQCLWADTDTENDHPFTKDLHRSLRSTLTSNREQSAEDKATRWVGAHAALYSMDLAAPLEAILGAEIIASITPRWSACAAPISLVLKATRRSGCAAVPPP